MRLSFTSGGRDDAPVVVLAHSLGTTHEMWEPQVRALGERFRLLRYDHRGHGGSDAPPGPYSIAELGRDVIELLDEIGVERAHFCGLSLGGMVGMWLGAHAPERIERLVLACTTAHYAPGMGWEERAAAARSAGVASLVDGVLERWFTPDFRERSPEDVARVEELLVATSGEGYAACCEAIGSMDLRPVLSRIIAPTLVISAEHDPATPPARGAEIAAAIQGARQVVIEGASHLANVEQPAVFTRHVLEHLTASYGVSHR